MKRAGPLLCFVTAACAAGLPLSFAPDQGQAGASADFLAYGECCTLAVNARGASLFLPGSRLSMRIAGARAAAKPEALSPLPGKTSYLRGERRFWRAGLPTFARVRYRNVYPGIDVVYRGRGGQLEFDFLLAPGASPSNIRITYEGLRHLRIARDGGITLETRAGALRQHRPVIYQELAGVRHLVRGKYVLTGRRLIGFQLGPYDRRRPLVIDPTLSYATRLDGLGVDQGDGICVDGAGNVYIAGSITSQSGDTDAFVTKLDASGKTIFYTAILGGRSNDRATGVAVDSAGRISITGVTSSYDFPVAGIVFQNQLAGESDAFLARLNSSGSRLVYSTYLGGSDQDRATAIALDGSGNALVAGATYSPDLPTNSHAFQRRNAGGMDAFLARFEPDGRADYCTYLGGSGDDGAFGVAADASGNAYVTGSTASHDFPVTKGVIQTSPAGLDDAFAARLDATGELTYSTLLGGSDRDMGRSVAVDSSGAVVIAGNTGSEDLPVTRGAFQRSYGGGGTDIFIARLNPTATTLAYSTLLGGDGDDTALGVALNSAGDAFVTGATDSTDYPVVGNASRPGNHFGTYVILSELNPSGSALLFSAVFGSPGSDQGRGIAAACDGNVYLTGTTSSPRDAFFVRFTGFPASPGCHLKAPGGKTAASQLVRCGPRCGR
ncbi:MAG: SBBP repeat-containing protein [Acidobacteria bacterium]|nr:SBBP repeat-containing protein [Acidobacteriota bacterium]